MGHQVLFALEVLITIAKLTDATLRLWAELLEAVPWFTSCFKSFFRTDSDTQRLLRRRMLRQGLDPDRSRLVVLDKRAR